MRAPVEAGNEVLIPLFDAEAANKLFHITWSQNLASRNADYYLVTADNVNTAPALTRTTLPVSVSSSLEAEGYKLKVGSSLQYGQKNAAGELRFVVYHDKERKPYQHRFFETVDYHQSSRARQIIRIRCYRRPG
ncbi:hypothetical protein BJ165DRAFT_1533505 [Panaeolus papilionaceus]|nr:hypothetical protein BJ165DRAFT_1533505 [Panaeolus papilionaceus]